jgi:UDP-glucose 4-epimerase
MGAGMTALVTGGAGFIGSHLVEKLIDENAQVIVLDNLSSGDVGNIPVERVRFVHGDVRDAELVRVLVRESDIVFHLAEYIPETRGYGAGHVVRYSTDNPMQEFDVSCKGTLTVLEECRKYKTCVVLASSAAVYGESGSRDLREESPLSPSSPYGASKLCAETYVRTYSRTYGLAAVILRLFNVYGPRQAKYVMHDLLLKLAHDPTELTVLGSGEEERDFVFVDDAVDAMLLVTKTDGFNGEVFNIGTGVSTSIKQIVYMITRKIAANPRVTFTQSSWKGDVRRLVADITKIRKLGFEPKYLLEDGLGRLVEWYRKKYDQAGLGPDAF